MTAQQEQPLKPEQIQSALEVMRAYLTAPKSPEGRTPVESDTELDQNRVRLIETELKLLLKDYLDGQLNDPDWVI